MSADERKEEAEWTVRLALTKGRAELLVIQDPAAAGWEEAPLRLGCADLPLQQAGV